MTDRNGIEIDYCPECRGVWLDRGELDKIIELLTPKVAEVSVTEEVKVKTPKVKKEKVVKEIEVTPEV